MKKLIAIALIAVMVLGLAACGTVNDAEVSVLWSGDGVVKVPNSLINAVERAMYIENISYKHYGANGDQAAQTKQAEDALNAGCAALVVELVDVSAAQTIVDAAKAKDVPVIFINSAVDAAVVSGYAKCVSVFANTETIGKIQGEQIAEVLITEKKGLFAKEASYTLTKEADRNEDGTITYLAIGEVANTVETVNAKLTEKGLPALVPAAEITDVATATDAIAALTESSFTNESKKVMGLLSVETGTAVDLIITADDATALDVLMALQAKGYNKDRLTTHCIPVYTVGDEADYKALVLADRPEGAHEADNVQEYYESKQYIVDLRTVEEDALHSMIYTTSNIIEDGRIAGSAIVDYDSIAVSAAAALADLLSGKTVETQVIEIDYATI